MAKKPTYEELEQRIRKLEKESAELKRVKKAIAESEEKFRILAEFSVVGIFIFQNMKFTYVNPALMTIFGDSAENFLKKGPIHYTHPDYHQASEKYIMSQFSENPNTKTFIFKGLKTKGEEIYCEVQGRGIEYQGKPAIIGTLVDITERKQAEEALRESEERYRTILESIDEGYYEVDLKGNFTFVNNSMCKIRGASMDELIGMNNQEYMDKKNAKRVYRKFNEVYRTGKPVKKIEWESIRKDGIKRHVESSASLMKDSNGNPVGFRGITADITERKQAEEALRESEERHRSLVESSSDAILMLDADRRIVSYNQAFSNLFGYDNNEAIGKSIRIIHPSDESFRSFGDVAYSEIDRADSYRAF